MALPVETELDTISIVLIGAFNPAIFHPLWFAAQEMLSREDAEAAEVAVIHKDLTQFQARQVKISVEHQRFVATCAAIHRNIVRDLVLSCFGRVLVHTPLGLMGINRELHFNCGSERNRSAFGFAIAPLEPWGKWGEEIAKNVKEDKRRGGMMRIQIREEPRPDKFTGYVQVEVQPSALIRNMSGIWVQTNDHFQFENNEEHPAQEAMETLETVWESANAKAESIIEDIMLRATGKK